jgi:hypothetical protein
MKVFGGSALLCRDIKFMLNSAETIQFMTKSRGRTLFVLGAIPLIIAIALATIHASKHHPSEILAAELKNVAPLGEIIKTSPVVNQFRCSVATLESFRILSATYGRTNTSTYKITLDGERIIAPRVFFLSGAQFKNNAWIDFTLNVPIKQCGGKMLRLTVESDDATSGNAVTLFTSAKYYDGNILQPVQDPLTKRSLLLELNVAEADAFKESSPASVADAAGRKTAALPSAQPTTPMSTVNLKTKLEALGNFGEILKINPLEQKVTCPVQELNTLHIFSATYARKNTATYALTLTNAGNTVFSATIDAANVKDNDWINFKLPNPITKCLGQPLILKIEAIKASAGNALTFYNRPTYYEGALVSPVTPASANRQLLIEINR